MSTNAQNNEPTTESEQDVFTQNKNLFHSDNNEQRNFIIERTTQRENSCSSQISDITMVPSKQPSISEVYDGSQFLDGLGMTKLNLNSLQPGPDGDTNILSESPINMENQINNQSTPNQNSSSSVVPIGHRPSKLNFGDRSQGPPPVNNHQNHRYNEQISPLVTPQVSVQQNTFNFTDPDSWKNEFRESQGIPKTSMDLSKIGPGLNLQMSHTGMGFQEQMSSGFHEPPHGALGNHERLSMSEAVKDENVIPKLIEPKELQQERLGAIGESANSLSHNSSRFHSRQGSENLTDMRDYGLGFFVIDLVSDDFNSFCQSDS